MPVLQTHPLKATPPIVIKICNIERGNNQTQFTKIIFSLLHIGMDDCMKRKMKSKKINFKTNKQKGKTTSK